MSIVNSRVLAHPLNWITVWSMALILFYVVHLLTAYVQGRHPGKPATDSTEGAAGPGTDVPENAFA